MTRKQATRRSSLVRDPAFRLVFCAFACFGLLFGVWQVALADLQLALSLSEGTLGAAITVGFVASFPAMLLGGRLADRVGTGRLMGGAALAMALAFLGLAFVGQYAALIGLLLVFFGASGAFDVGINAAAIGVEQENSRPAIPYLHAAFSGSAALGALAAGLLLFLGVPFRVLYLMITLVMCILAYGAYRRRAPAGSGDTGSATTPTATRLYRVPAILLLAGITGLAFLSEGTLETWSAIYLRSSLDAPALLGAGGPTVFHAAMLAGRLLSGRAVTVLGRRRLLCVAGASAGLGMLVALATTAPPLVLLGLLVTGLALAGVAPIAFSLAGDLAPGRAGEASSVITTVGYTGFLLGPALIGGLAELAGLRVALGSVAVAGGAIAALSTRVASKSNRER